MVDSSGGGQSSDSINSEADNVATYIETWFESQILIEVGFGGSGDEATPFLYVPKTLLTSNFGYFERLLDPANQDAFVEAKTGRVMLDKDERAPFRTLLAWLLAPHQSFGLLLTLTPEAEISLLIRVAQLGDYLAIRDSSGLMSSIAFHIKNILVRNRMALTDEHVARLYVIPNQQAVYPIRTILAQAAVQPFMQQKVVQESDLDSKEWGANVNYDLKDASNKFQLLIDGQSLYAADVLVEVGNTIKSGVLLTHESKVDSGMLRYSKFTEPLHGYGYYTFRI